MSALRQDSQRGGRGGGHAASWAPTPLWGVEWDPLRDKTYRLAKLGPDVVAFLAWLELGGAATRTIGDYETSLAVFCRMYPKTGIEDITDEQLGQVWRKFPARSRKTRVAPYRQFFKWAMQTRRIQVNPIDLMPTIRQAKPKPFDLFSEAEIELLLGLPMIDAAPMGLFFEAGLRMSEACAMTDRRWGPESIQVINGKGGKDRRIPTSQRLAAILAEWEIVEGIRPEDHILYAINQPGNHILRSRPIGTGSFYRWWRRTLENAGVRYRNPHMARHTCATRWRQQGHAIDDISRWLGHTDLATTERFYVHSTFEESLGRFREIEALVG